MEISRKHALIKYENNAWWIYDLRVCVILTSLSFFRKGIFLTHYLSFFLSQSTNGIFVQDIKLKPNGKARLDDGASVCLGPPDQGHFKFLLRG